MDTSADVSALPRVPDQVPSSSNTSSLNQSGKQYNQAVQDIRSKLPESLQYPKVGIVCGSGLQGLAELLQDKVLVNYGNITGFGESTVKGHQSALAFGFLGKSRTPVVCQLGRFHAYEGFPLEQVAYPMRVMKSLGITATIITNAAGGLDPNMKVGTIVTLLDHISLPSMTSMNPLIGHNQDAFGPRFPPMSDAYDFELRKAAFRASHKLGFEKGSLTEGIYAWVAGPTYETRAEQRFLLAAGATVVGMSTIPEVIAARHAGVRVLVLSLCTNIVVNEPYESAQRAVELEFNQDKVPSLATDGDRQGLDGSAAAAVAVPRQEIASHQEVLDVSARRANDMRALVEMIVEDEFSE